MRAQLLHLSGPMRGRTVTHTQPVVRVGSGADCECRLPVASVAEHHARIAWIEADCRFHLRREQGAVFVNGQEVEEVYLRDGDQLEFGTGGPRARFRVYVPEGAVCKPVRRMLSDAAELARHSGGAAATRMFTKDLLTQATPTLKVGFPLLVFAIGVTLAWLGGWFVSWSVQERERQTADQIAREEIQKLRDEWQAQFAQMQQLAASQAVLERIQQHWSRGVCLVHGIYRMRSADGGWVERAPGRPYEAEYTGSGFLVRADGQVVTNRHVALPWTVDAQDQALIELGATPVFVRLTATFPGRQPIDVEQESIVRRQDDHDVAVFTVLPDEVRGIPVLPLRRDGTEGHDQRAIVVGYPTGLAALLARASSETLEKLRQNAATMADAIAQLAEADQIRPIITQGIVSNVEPHLIAYDASTTGGGSGGPVFSDKGDVIAVNFAVQRNFGGNNLGVPIRFALALLRE